jgi:signal transduction histidine kinase/ActR/RegA family two-component response regulator/DNA-binding transcriptional ArsR family regulator
VGPVPAIRFENRRLRRQYFVNLGGLGLVLVCLLGGWVLKADGDARREAEQDLLGSGEALRSQLQEVLAIGERNVGQLGSAAADLAQQPMLTRTAEARKAWALTREQGSLTEAGSEDQRRQTGSVYFRTRATRDLAADLAVAVELNRLMAWTHRHNSMFVWSYSYLASKDVTGLYPYLPGGEMLALHKAASTDQALDRVFDGDMRPLDLAGPARNPQRHNIWTPVYPDQAGKGLMVSLLRPVYLQERLWGVVGTDLLLQEIQNLVNIPRLEGLRVDVVTAQGVVLASNRREWTWSGQAELAPAVQALEQSPGRFVQHEQSPWLMLKLQGPDWRVVLRPLPGQRLGAGPTLYAQMLVVLGLVLLIVLFIAAWFHLQLARPVMQLVNYIDLLEEKAHADIPPVPPLWRGWFESLRARAVERRQMLEALRDAHDHLEQQVAQRTASLQAEIHERELLEQSLLRAQQAADDASHAKSRFLADMSHEIRTPLNAVIGLAHLHLQDPSGPDARQLVEKILQSGEALLALLDDILDLSKIEAGKLVLSQQAIDLAGLARQVWSLFEINRRGNRVELVLDLPEQAPVWVEGDLLRLRQVLTNLMGNALKFTEQGRVSLQVSARDCPSAPGLMRLRFAVQDTGIGMTQAQQARLFNAFEQASSDTWQQYKGTGLGLAISALLVKAMGGELQVRSALGQGATFWFEIDAPALPAPVAEPAPAASGTLTLEGVKVLLVEDHPLNRLVCEGMLKAQGCQTTSVHDGQQAVDWCCENGFGKIDLILMDVQMPVMDGFEACRQLRAMGCTLPILALTANAFTEDRAASLKAGMNDHLTKPFDPRKLASVLKGWVGVKVERPS